MKEAVIVAYGRSAIGRSQKGTLRSTRPEELAGQVLTGTLQQCPQAIDFLEDVILGCAMPEGEQGCNIGKIVAAKAKLPVHVPAQTVNRFCSSGLQTIAAAANAIMCGQIRAAAAGGVESMSIVPMGGYRNVPDPVLINEDPDQYIAMGLTAERVAEKYGITRERQDEFAATSHQRAAEAQAAGKFDGQIIPVRACDNAGELSILFDKDEGIRSQTSPATLARLRPVFKNKGTVTAGNSSQTSDGAAFAIVMERELAKELGLTPVATFISFAVSGVEPGLMGIGPVKAIPKALKLAGLKLKDIDLFELNEAFASQALACMDTLGMAPQKVNVNGGAIALGHPLGCTGAALTAKLLAELKSRGGRYGMVSMCIGGGQGAAGIFRLC